MVPSARQTEVPETVRFVNDAEVPHTDEEKRLVDETAVVTKDVINALLAVAFVANKFDEFRLVIVPVGAEIEPVTFTKPIVEVPIRPVPAVSAEIVPFVAVKAPKVAVVPETVVPQRLVAKKFVEVAELIKAVVRLAEVPQSVVAKRLVDVVLPPVAFVQVSCARFEGERTFKLVNVAFEPTTFVNDAFVAKRLVEVEFVAVAFVAIKFVTVLVPAVSETTLRSLMIPDAAESVVKVAFVPTTFTLKRFVEVEFVATN